MIPKKIKKQLAERDKLRKLSAQSAVIGRGVKLKTGHTHPGYIIGVHWLSVAYERICAGESEIDVMHDYGYRYEYRVGPQAPIVRIHVHGDKITGATFYAPGLPDGEHDLYCEPEATAPYLRADQP